VAFSNKHFHYVLCSDLLFEQATAAANLPHETRYGTLAFGTVSKDASYSNFTQKNTSIIFFSFARDFYRLNLPIRGKRFHHMKNFFSVLVGMLFIMSAKKFLLASKKNNLNPILKMFSMSKIFLGILGKNFMSY